MTIKFQADADLNNVIVLAALRRLPALDFRSALAANLAGLDDASVLEQAAHFAAFLRQRASPGLIIVPQHLAPSRAADDLILIASGTRAEEWVNRVAFLPI